MAFSTSTKFPAPAFLFSAEIFGVSFRFHEISGLKAEMGFKEVRCGGENNRQYKIPTVASYGDVTFKKGIINAGDAKSSSKDLFKHIKKSIDFHKSKALKKSNIAPIKVNLHNEKEGVVCSWTLDNPSLLSWEISTLNSSNNDIAFETLVFSCSELKSTLY